MKKKIKFIAFLCVVVVFAHSCKDESGEYVRQLYTDAQKETAFTACLTAASDSAVNHLCVSDGFSQYADGLYRIDFTPLQGSVFQTLRDNGCGYLADSLVLLSNRVAENCNTAVMTPIFKEAINSLVFYDHDALINGDSTAVTDYFVRFKDGDMQAALQSPVFIRMNLFGVNDCWNRIAARYYQYTATPVAFDLQGYVVQKMLDGLYGEMRVEEVNIRTDSTHYSSADSLLYGAGL